MNLKNVGSACQRFRKRIGKRQIDVATDIKCSVENISAFETGRNNSVIILLWYFDNGMTLHDLYIDVL